MPSFARRTACGDPPAAPTTRHRWRPALAALAVVVAGSVLPAACASSDGAGFGERAAGSTVGEAPDPATTDLDATPTPGSGPATSPAAAVAPVAGLDRLDGLGDRLYPQAGNAGMDVLRVDAALDWQPDGNGDGVLDAVVTLDVTLTADRPGLQFDLRSMQVLAATVDGVPAPVTHDDGELVLAPEQVFGRGSTHRVVVRYTGRPEPVDDGTGAGIAVGWTTLGAGSYVASEPIGASTWLVGNDHPSDKAVYRLSVTAPAELDVVATGPLRERRAGPRPATTSWVFEPRDPVASYLVSVAIGRFGTIEAHAPRSGVAIRHAVPVGREAEFARVLAPTGTMIDTFSELFGPYPFEVYGVVVVDERLGYALENQTLSLFDTNLALHGGEETLVHELAHQWFGDSVSVAQWSDIWLNEGFATYAEALWAERQEPGYDLDATMAEAWQQARRLGPIGAVDRAELFGDAVYDRGGLTLHALRRTIGDAAFFPLLRRWAAAYRNQSVTTEQFIALASEAAGRPLDDFFDAWLFAPTMPALPR